MCTAGNHVVDLVGVARAAERADPGGAIRECCEAFTERAAGIHDNIIVLYGEDLVGDACGPEGGHVKIVGLLIARATTGGVGLPRDDHPAGDATRDLHRERTVGQRQGVLHEAGAVVGLGLNPAFGGMQEAEGSHVHGPGAHGPCHLTAGMEGVGEGKLERCAGEHVRLFRGRHVFEVSRRLNGGVIIGIEVAGGPLLLHGQLRVGEAGVLARCLSGWNIHRIAVEPRPELLRPGVTSEDAELIRNGLAELAVIGGVLCETGEQLGSGEIVGALPAEVRGISRIGPLQVRQTFEDGADVVGEGRPHRCGERVVLDGEVAHEVPHSADGFLLRRVIGRSDNDLGGSDVELRALIGDGGGDGAIGRVVVSAAVVGKGDGFGAAEGNRLAAATKDDRAACVVGSELAEVHGRPHELADVACVCGAAVRVASGNVTRAGVNDEISAIGYGSVAQQR